MFLKKIKLVGICVYMFFMGLLIKRTEKKLEKSIENGSLTKRRAVRSARKCEQYRKSFDVYERSALKLFLCFLDD
ncbi:MAG: hypothetical protein Q4B31_03065 [Clostridia bacterium]|nr:hypothetical protein [Clostridia bacterium]